MSAVLHLSPDAFPMLFGALALQPAPSRRDLLVVAALVLDVADYPGRDGGQPGDPNALAERIGPPLGVSGSDLGPLVAIVGHRRLLVDTAAGRDVTDDATISAVARAVGSSDVLGVLHAVSLLDALNDQTAHTAWRQELVADLVNRVAHVLDGGEMHEVAWPQFPTSEVRELMALPRTVLRADGHRLTVVAPDRPGLFSRVAGVLSLHGLDVLGAQAHSDESGMAASEFRVAGPAEGALEWERVITDLGLALDGRLALESRLAERALGSPATRVLSPGSVSIDNSASALATVVEVRATDSPGLLYRVTRALADMGLDIRHARVQTLGEDVLDTFYVRDILGDKVTDWRYLAEIERAVLHELTGPSRTALACRAMADTPAGSSDFTQDLLRWSEALSGIARTGLGFTQSLYERERFEEVLKVAADIRSAADEDLEVRREAGHFVQEWLDGVGEGVAGYVTPKVAVGAVVGNDLGQILLVQRSDSGIWLYPTGWADVGYSPAEVAVKEVKEETGIDCEPLRLIAVIDGLRMGFTRVPLYSLVFHCRATGGELERHPLETSDVGWFGQDDLPFPIVGFDRWGKAAFAAIRGEAVEVQFDAPRAPVWRGPSDLQA